MDEITAKAGRTIVETCSRLMPSETAVVITDKETITIGDTIKVFAEKISDEVSFHVLEDYAERPLKSIPEEIKKDVKKANVTYYCAQSKSGELKDFRSPLVKLAISVGREIHMPNIEEKIMRAGMQADYFKVASLTYLIMGIAVNSKTAKVVTPAGTDLAAKFSDNLKWVPDTGLLWYRGMFGNLPAGEAYTCPEKLDGIMVVDGALGDFFNQKYGTLEDTPVRIPVSGCRADIKNIICDNKELLKELQEYLQQDKNANRAGEFAVGTNISLDGLIGNLLQDEKFPGIHVAFGYPYPEKTGADWESGGHVDGIMKKCSLWFDNIQVMDNGEFIEEEILKLE
jgi:aminopeptidase